jgi:hypothetical protein
MEKRLMPGEVLLPGESLVQIPGEVTVCACECDAPDLADKPVSPFFCFVLFIYLFCNTRVWTQDLHLEPLFCDEFFQDDGESHKLFA